MFSSSALVVEPREEVSKADGDALATSCCIQLIQALDYLRTGRCADSIALLKHIYECLPAELTHMSSLIGAIIRGYTECVQAQEALLAASKQFAQADRDQQARFLRLEQLLSQYEEHGNTCVYPFVQQATHCDTPYDTYAQQKDAPPEVHRLKQRTPQSKGLPPLHVLCFGRFQVLRSSEPLTLCQNRYGQAILRYLVAQTKHRATADILMEAFWPENDVEVARRKLQVAVSALRCSLNQSCDCSPGGGYILYKDQYYQINPDVTITSDRDEFLALYEQGRHSSSEEAIAYYERACQFYTGPCFVEDIYANWSSSLREQCMLAYSAMNNILSEYALARGNYDDAIHRANLVLAENRCDEAAYRLLMQAYAMQGCRSEAIRQYQRCEQVLHEELGVAPMPETIQVFQDILNVTHELK